MDIDNKIFHSDITRVHKTQTSNLQELLDITPAIPLSQKSNEINPCGFQPKCDKVYIPKLKSRLKVRTVRDIRNVFENDVYRYIVEDIEKQKNILLSKIRSGSAHHDTQKFATRLLKADHPISRTTWQMLRNINPESNLNPTQFVLWNGRRIKVVGSKGGVPKFISKYDLGKMCIKNETNSIKYFEKTWKKHGLLRNSLDIRFKPGPLRKKKNLDFSHQKYNMGPIELVKLPKPVLEIQPIYGKIVEPIMANFLNKFRQINGEITENWAEFALSVLGTFHNNKLVQVDQENCVKFDLNYKCAQQRILMRRDNNCNLTTIPKNSDTLKKSKNSEMYDDITEIKNVINNILDSVEVSLSQDSIYTVEKDSSPRIEPLDVHNTSISKEKTKKKYGELDRLDVTVIQIPGIPKLSSSRPCTNAYCYLGCVCESLNFTNKWKQHCGNIECMFGCHCKISKFKDIDLLENECHELIPGLMNLDNEINAKLAKEEQKFHQTVVLSGEKSILLKQQKRNIKISKKYADFYSSLQPNIKKKKKKILAIVEKKLNCVNIEPWCMVHNLYRCFCKGKFIDSANVNSINATIQSSNIPTVDLTKMEFVQKNFENLLDKNVKEKDETLRVRSRRKYCETSSSNSLDTSYDCNLSFSSCARVEPYYGRKHDGEYYKIMNNKIKQMEKNDTMLQKKMLRRIMDHGGDSLSNDDQENSDQLSGAAQENKVVTGDLSKPIQIVHSSRSRNTEINKGAFENMFLNVETSNLTEDNPPNIEHTNKQSIELAMPFEISGDMYKPVQGRNIAKNFLKPWIEKSYKNYLENTGKLTLEKPRKGKVTLHLFESLLSRYKNGRNFFLTTSKRPFRTFIATDPSNPFFKDCININSIRYDDLSKYPNIVKNFLTNVINQGTFCILGGWNECWEIIGCVKKNSMENRLCNSDLTNIESPRSNESTDYCEGNWWNEQDAINPDNECPEDGKKKVLPDNGVSSKWFLMKLETDFTDLYCHKKGFFVEYTKLIHAINLARLTRKTVVINKQDTSETNNIPFGIYALPMATERWAIVGPYEADESLGLEIVKSKTVSLQDSTKGFWLTTNKVDNVKLLHDPMIFLSQNSMSNASKVSIPGSVHDTSTPEQKRKQKSEDDASISKKIQKLLNKEDSDKTIAKLVKPIRIRRTNGFYHLSPKKKVLSSWPSTSKSLINYKDQEEMNNPENKIIEPLIKCSEPDSEVSHIKITSVYSENVEEKLKTKENKGMFILKPEEINKKIVNPQKTDESMDEETINADIESFLGVTQPSTSVDSDECLVISDEDNEEATCETYENWTDVWIQCSNVNNLKWIRAKRNKDNLLRVHFPGFDATTLYTESEALSIINNTVTTKITIPDTLVLKWKVSDVDKSNVGAKLFINQSSRTYSINPRKFRMSKIPTKRSPSSSSQIHEEPKLFDDLLPPDAIVLNNNTDLIDGLEKTSRLLEDETILLMTEAEMNQTEIGENINLPVDSAVEMTETLQTLMCMNNELGEDDLM